ncbi:hypothetical protein CDD83_4512 [Cordyceps sp. RAO-2017]|nr:hypothetical protein CDD83_4512 [Cordyceps sp. RAO-2017]
MVLDPSGDAVQFVHRTDSDTNLDAAIMKSACAESQNTRAPIGSDSNMKGRGVRKCPHPGCPFRAKNNRDVQRHQLAVHDKSESFFCNHKGCSRRKGWPRKDSRDRHVKTHAREREPSEPKDAAGILLNPSYKEILLRLDQTEKQLRELQKRYQEREDRLLRALTNG